MKRRSLVAVGAGLVAVAGAGAVAATVAGKRWAAGADATGGEPLRLPDGTERCVTTPDGTELSTIVAGEGERTFVLSHCWTCDRRIWGPVARHLVDRGHRVVLYDQRGHGRSTVGRDGLTIEALGDDLAAVLADVDARDAVVAGHSMGGMATQAFAVAHPDELRDRVRGIALVSTSCGQLGIDGIRGRLGGRVLGGTVVDRALANRRFGPLLVRGAVGRSPALPHLQAVIDTFSATAPATRAGFLRAISAMDFAEALEKVDVPALVVVGSHDQLTPVAHARRLAELLPNARLEVLPDAGHMLPSEAPDRLTDLLEAL